MNAFLFILFSEPITIMLATYENLANPSARCTFLRLLIMTIRRTKESVIAPAKMMIITMTMPAIPPALIAPVPAPTTVCGRCTESELCY